MPNLDLKDWLALLGVITGLVGSASALLASSVAVLTYRRNGPIVKIDVRKGWRLINASPPYSDKKIYTGITVYNRGRRHTTIAQVGESHLLRSGGAIYSDSMIYGSRKLDEEGATDYLVEEKPGKRRPLVGYYYATTRSGRTYRLFPYTPIVWLAAYPFRKVDSFQHRRSRKALKKKKDHLGS